MSVFSSIKTLFPESWRQTLRGLQIRQSIGHLHGPKQLALASNEAAVTCLVKNGELYIEQFIDHYFSLGFRHIYFLDNGSTDNTVPVASRYKNVTVCRSTMSVGAFQGLLKKHWAEMAVPAGWCLDVDIDEFFDYPFSDQLPLRSFLDYLNTKGYTAVVTQMLDMFSDKPLSALLQGRRENIKEVYRYYDLSNVTKVAYCEEAFSALYGDNNEHANAQVAIHWGGIRKTVYGWNCLLTKHSLFRTGAGIELFPHVHYVNGAKLADVSAALLHYKFASNAFESASQNEEAFIGIRKGYASIADTIRTRPNLRIKSSTAMEFHGVNALIESGFLFVSEGYKSLRNAYLKGHVRAMNPCYGDPEYSWDDYIQA